MGWVPPGHTVSLSYVRSKMPKMVYQKKTLEPKEFDHEPIYIYIWNQYNLGNALVHVYDHTHFYVNVRPKIVKNGTLAIQTLGVIDLKYGMHTQIDFGINICGIPPCYTTFNWCVQIQSAKKNNKTKQNQKELLNKDWT